MAHSKHMKPEHKAQVKAKLGHLLRRHPLGASAEAHHELAEIFEVHLLRVEDISLAESRGGLAKVIRWTGQWHCQIFADGEPVGFARCAATAPEGDEWNIHSVFKSHLAKKMAAAVRHVDAEKARHDAEVKLIFAPAFHLYAFLMEDDHESHVLVIDSAFTELAGKEFHTEADFLKRLQTLRPIRGLIGGKAPSIRITPENPALTEMKSTVFHAYDDQGSPIAVNWAIAPGAPGKIVANAHAVSATYTAPQQINDRLAITVTASVGTASASATILLIPVTVQIVPAAAQLKHNQPQQFVATVAGDPTNRVEWLLSPQVGTITNAGFYTPDDSITDSTSVKVIAISALGHKTAASALTLIPPPWTPWKRNLLGSYILSIFMLVFLLVWLWPPSGPDSQLTAQRQAAQAKVDADALNIKKAEDAARLATAQGSTAATVGAAGAISSRPARDQVNNPPPSANASSSTNASLGALRSNQTDDQRLLEEAKERENESKDPLDHPGTFFGDRAGATFPRDVDLLLLVVIGGALGAFLHCVRSFTAFVGNDELRGSWAWWYYLHPFLGAILSLAFYMAVRGGFMAVTSGTAIKTSDVSPFALASVAIVVGMFSKNAMTKLSDIFETLFQPSTATTMKNPLGSAAPIKGQATGIQVTSVAPASGSTSGGTTIVIVGSGFVEGATVNVGGISATSVNWKNSTSISCETPSHLAGSVDIEVVNPDGQRNSLARGYQYV